MKFRRLMILLLLMIKIPAMCQVLTVHEKDSLKNLVCMLAEKDQLYRKGLICDTIALARKNNDTAYLNHWDKLLHAQDVDDIQLLCNIIDRVGYPNNKTLGKGTCDLIGVLIHWAKEYPEWFNNASTIAIFKREIANGNLRLSDIDMSEFFFISFTHPDIKYMTLINNARMSYGLVPYSKDQYLSKKAISPMLNDGDVRQYRDRLPVY